MEFYRPACRGLCQAGDADVPRGHTVRWRQRQAHLVAPVTRRQRQAPSPARTAERPAGCESSPRATPTDTAGPPCTSGNKHLHIVASCLGASARPGEPRVARYASLLPPAQTPAESGLQGNLETLRGVAASARPPSSAHIPDSHHVPTRSPAP